MAGTQEGLELRAEYSWNTEPIYLLKGDGTWAEANVPREVVFGTELTTVDGQVRDLMTYVPAVWNGSELRLELELYADVQPTNDDLVFNRLAMIRGGKAQGTYVGDFDSAGDTFTITSTPVGTWVPGDTFVAHGTFEEFSVQSVGGGSGEILTLNEDILADTTGVTVSDSSGTLMVVYVFTADALIFQNNTTRITVTGFSFAG